MTMRSRILFAYRYRSLLFRLWQGNAATVRVAPGCPPRVECVFNDAGLSDALTLDLLNASANSIPLPENSVRSIVLHMDGATPSAADAHKMLLNACAVLKPGGKLTVYTTDAPFVAGAIQRVSFEKPQQVRGLAVRHQGVSVLEARRSSAGASCLCMPCGTLTLCIGLLARTRALIVAIFRHFRRVSLRFSYVPIRALGFAEEYLRRKTRIPPSAPRSLLVFSMGGLGDFIRMLPFLETLRGAYPTASITVLHNGGLRDMSIWSHWFEEAVALPLPRDFTERFKGEARPFSVYATCPHVLWRLRRGRFDIGWVFGFNQATGNFGTELLSLCRVRYRIGVHYGSNVSRLNWHHRPPSKKASLVTFFDRGLDPLGLRIADRNVRLSIADDDTQWAREYLTGQGVPQTTAVAVLVPGAGGIFNSKRWPPERFAALADHIQKTLCARVILTGSGGEVDLTRQVVEQMKTTPVVTTGALTIRQLAAILSQATAVVTNDTAVLHLAGTVQTPTIVGIFGPTDHANIVPPDTRFTSLQSRVACSPCSHIDGNDPETVCNKATREECLLAISVDEVFDALVRGIQRALPKTATLNAIPPRQTTTVGAPSSDSRSDQGNTNALREGCGSENTRHRVAS